MTDPPVVPILWALRNRWRGRPDGPPPPPLCGHCKIDEGIGWLDHLWLCARCIERIAGIGAAA